MKKEYSQKKESADDKFRRLVDYGIEAPSLIAAFSPFVKFAPISDMPWPNGINDFHTVFVSAAVQTGLIEYDEGKIKFRWTCKNELTDEEKSKLYKKIIEISRNRSSP